MEKVIYAVLLSILAAIGIAIIAVLYSLLYSLLYAVSGYFTGWVLSDLFTFAGRWVISGAHAVGVEITIGQLPAIEAMLGFVGTFFKATQTNKNEKA